MSIKKWAIAIHGGITRSNLQHDIKKIYEEEHMKSYLEEGKSLLKNGNTSLYVVEKMIIEMENNDMFNAGKGSVTFRTGSPVVEMDACIMKGSDKRSGTVQSIYGVKNPISIAKRLLIQNNPETYVLSGKGAYQFAKLLQFDLRNDFYFGISTSTVNYTKKVDWNTENKINIKDKYREENFGNFGTVGCVCQDIYGNLCAGTSTGGLVGKIRGRVSDVGIVGAGTYAENGICAVSCTGIGEKFIQEMVSHNIACRMKYLKDSLKNSIVKTFESKNLRKNSGGCIAIDSKYNIEVFDTTNSSLLYVQDNYQT